MSDELPIWQEQVRNGCMRIVFLFFPQFPRASVRRAKRAGFSPENLIRYLEAYIAYIHERYGAGTPPTVSSVYFDLLAYIRDFHADTLDFKPEEMYILSNNAVVETLSNLRAQEERRWGEASRRIPMRELVAYQRAEMCRKIPYDPILKRWLHIEKDTPEEMIIRIGS